MYFKISYAYFTFEGLDNNFIHEKTFLQLMFVIRKNKVF